MRKNLGNNSRIALSYNNIGSNFHNKGTYLLENKQEKNAINAFEQALSYYFNALEIQEKLGERRNIAMSYTNMGGGYFSLGEYNNALEWFFKSIEISTSINDNYLLKETYNGIAGTFEKIENYNKALKYYKLYTLYNDSIFNENSIKTIAEIETKYKTAEKEKTIKDQQLQLINQELQIKNKQVLLISFAGFILFLTLFSIFFISKIKNKQRLMIEQEINKHQKQHTKTLIETIEYERQKIATDLHDGVGQTLTSTILNFEYLNEKIQFSNQDNKNTFNQALVNLNTAYSEMRGIAHQMMPRALKTTGLFEAMSDLLDKTFQHSSISFTCNSTLKTIPSTIVAVAVYRVFQEILANAIKHSAATKLLVTLTENNKNLYLIVEDNGIGIKKEINSENLDETEQPKGIGIINIIMRTKLLNGVFLLEKGKVKGTIATLIIPQFDEK